MCLATIIDEHLDSMAVEWEENQVSVYAKRPIDPKEAYLSLCDILSFFQYLEKEGMVFVHLNPNINQERALYNHDMYKKVGDRYVSLDETDMDVNIFRKPYVMKYSIPSQLKTTIYSNLPSLLDKYVCAIVQPTQELVDCVNNGFKTKEDINFQRTTIISKISIWVAIIIGLASIILNITNNCCHC